MGVSPSLLRLKEEAAVAAQKLWQKHAPRVFPMAPRDRWYGDADYKERGGKMVEMSPDEFIDNAAPMRLDDEARENIDDLKRHIEEGGELDPLVIYGDKSSVHNSDGRHRAIAAKELGIQEVPVLDLRAPLDPSQASRMERAGAQGFDQDTFHYSRKQDDIEAFHAGNTNSGIFDALGVHSGNVDAANARAMSTRSMDPADGKLLNPKGSTYPLKIKTEKQLLGLHGQPMTEMELQGYLSDVADKLEVNQFTHEGVEAIREYIWGQGFDSIPYVNLVEDAGSISYISPPNKVRSVNAAFDPAKRDSANLLASAAGIGVLGASGESEAGPVGSAKRAIKAYHGSPHDFDEFKMSQIGTGEGAQAYGHGLYAAESEKVAETYRDALTFKNTAKGIDQEAVKQIQLRGGRQEAKNYVLHQIQVESKKLSPDSVWIDKNKELLEKIDSVDFDANKLGHMYEVNINTDPESLLNWDAPLSAQSEKVKNALLEDKERLFFEPQDPNGASLYQALYEDFDGNDALASNYLKEKGVPGMRYKDGFSRLGPSQALVDSQGSREAALALAQKRLDSVPFGDTQGRTHWQSMVDDLQRPDSSNYVIFDDTIIEIAKKYGVAPGVVAAAMQSPEADASTHFNSLYTEGPQQLAQALGKGANFVFDAIEIPTRGLHGLAAALGTAAEGGSFDQALNRGADVSRMSIPQISQHLGTYTADRTGNPYAAALVDALTNVVALEP